MGVDYGMLRIGVALSDPGERIATPTGTIQASGTASGNVKCVLEWAAGNEVEGIVVGLPLNMDGTDSEQTRVTRAFVTRLADATSLPVELWDERLSSHQADQTLTSMNATNKRRRKMRDALAAQAILQRFLDARPPTE